MKDKSLGALATKVLPLAVAFTLAILLANFGQKQIDKMSASA